MFTKDTTDDSRRLRDRCRRLRLGLVGLAALVAAALLGPAGAVAGAAPAQSGPSANRSAAAAPPASRVDGRPTSLDDAVAAGRLEQRVADELRRSGQVSAIVVLEYRDVLRDVAHLSDAAEVHAARQAFDEQESDALQGVSGVEVVKRWRNLPTAFVHFASEQALLDVLAHDDVIAVGANERLRQQSSQHLSYIRQTLAQQYGYNGAGTYVAVLDSGADYQRWADFGSCPQPGVSTCKVHSSWEVAPADGVLDSSGHGSNVAAIVTKVAPGTKIVDYDVFDGEFTNAFHVETALDHLIGLKGQGLNVVAANMSIGGGANASSDCSSSDAYTQKYAAAFSRARAAGIVPVVAAGNSAGGGTGAYGVGSPGCVASALTVGATYDANVGSRSWTLFDPPCTDSTTAADQVTCFSQTGPSLDLFAPGAEITAASGTWTGTSQAAPHVAGAVAVLAAAKPSATITQIESALVNSGPSVTDGKYGAPYAVTRRRLDVYSALTTLVGSTSDTTPPSVTAPLEQIDVPSKVTSTTVPVKLTWSASDAGGIAGYELWVSTNGASYVKDASVTTQVTRTYALTAGTSYRFAVRAQDRTGNWSGYAYSETLRPSIADDKIFSLTGSPWSRYSWASTFGGTAITSSTTSATLTYTFTGRDVALVAPKFSTGGRAKVYCDGTYYGLADLYATTTTGMNTVFWCRFTTSATHTMKVVLEGTSGRPRFDVDAFAVLA